MSDKEKLNTLYKLLRSIKKDVTYIKDVKTSDYPEWTSELKDYVRERTEGWKSSYYLDPKTKKYVFSFAKAFRNLFEFWIFPNRVCPFHCYYSNRYDYVLFSYNKYEWDEKSGLYCFEKEGSVCKGLFNPITYIRKKLWENN